MPYSIPLHVIFLFVSTIFDMICISSLIISKVMLKCNVVEMGLQINGCHTYFFLWRITQCSEFWVYDIDSQTWQLAWNQGWSLWGALGVYIHLSNISLRFEGQIWHIQTTIRQVHGIKPQRLSYYIWGRSCGFPLEPLGGECLCSNSAWIQCRNL